MNNDSFDPHSSSSHVNNKPQTTEQDPFDLQSLNASITPNENPSDSNAPDDLHTQMPNKLDALEPTHEFNFDPNSGKDSNDSGFQQQFPNQKNQWQGQSEGQPPPLNPHENNHNNHWQNQQPHSNSNNQQVQNPYAAPSMQSMQNSQFTEGDQGHFGLLEEPRQNDAGRGMAWFTEAFNIFKESWLMWILMWLAFAAITIFLSFIPLVSLVVNLVLFHFVAGFMVAAADQEEGYDVEISKLFLPFQTHLTPLIIVSVIYFGLCIIAAIPMVIIIVMSVGMPFLSGDMNSMNDTTAMLGILVGALVYLGLLIPALMAIYHAPALVVLHNVDAVQAMKMSFKGCMKNMVPFLIFGIVSLVVIAIGTLFTLGIGLLVLMPVLFLTYYTSYRDIWSERMIGE